MASGSVHLLVLVHGMWGNPDHLAEMSRIHREQLCEANSRAGPNGERVHVYLAHTNRESSTYDGIDWGGERVADEVLTEVKRIEEEGKKVTRFSITGYSLGGLIARYVVGILKQRSFFQDIVPVNFVTVATPHIGLIRYPTWWSSLAATLGPRLLSRTGEQFYAVDKWSATGRPLLEVMSDPERIFFKALSMFTRVHFYANGVNDRTVPYLTAAVETEDPYANHVAAGLSVEFKEEYHPLVKSYTLGTKPPPPKPTVFSKDWFESKRPPLPPALNFRFPGNILVYIALPVLIPVILSMVIVRLSRESRSSRSRIKLLEKDESYAKRLINIAGELEKSMEDAAMEYLDNPGTLGDLEAPPTSSQLGESNTDGQLVAKSKAAQKPALSDLQRRMASSLNSLPRLEKDTVFMDSALNSHAVIVSRDVKNFPHHKMGEGVLRHLADHFVV